MSQINILQVKRVLLIKNVAPRNKIKLASCFYDWLYLQISDDITVFVGGNSNKYGVMTYNWKTATFNQFPNVFMVNKYDLCCPFHIKTCNLMLEQLHDIHKLII